MLMYSNVFFAREMGAKYHQYHRLERIWEKFFQSENNRSGAEMLHGK